MAITVKVFVLFCKVVVGAYRQEVKHPQPWSVLACVRRHILSLPRLTLEIESRLRHYIIQVHVPLKKIIITMIKTILETD